MRLEVDGFVLRGGFGHEDHDHRLAFKRVGLDIQSKRSVERVGGLAGQVCADLVGLVESLGFVGWEQGQFFPRDAQQQPAAAQTRFIGEGTDGFQQRFADFVGLLGLDTLVFVEQVEAFEQLLRRHCVTSRSRSRIRFSTSASSASMSCSGRGGWYWKNTRLKLIS